MAISQRVSRRRSASDEGYRKAILERCFTCNKTQGILPLLYECHARNAAAFMIFGSTMPDSRKSLSPVRITSRFGEDTAFHRPGMESLALWWMESRCSYQSVRASLFSFIAHGFHCCADIGFGGQSCTFHHYITEIILKPLSPRFLQFNQNISDFFPFICFFLG